MVDRLQEKSLCEDIDGKKEAELSTSDMHNAESIARVTLKLMPIWVMLLMFAVIFQQPSTFFTNQGMVMNHSLGTRFLIPPAMLQSVITISIITMMPLYDKLMIPFFRFVLRDSKGITVLQRIGIGMLLSIAAMIIAATVETKRIQATKRGSTEHLLAVATIHSARNIRHLHGCWYAGVFLQPGAEDDENYRYWALPEHLWRR
ncbi:hypothetical protein HPP92_016386 [Vanilla planifolia]|uniref:Uncharacterized protein n=1 Tax=Vanilla planifolia TaxID=51239 RepID=A0A835QJZ4_VANPL|nr:hypothetical protein HPP92_016386 [Vanilla planifolia]